MSDQQTPDPVTRVRPWHGVDPTPIDPAARPLSPSVQRLYHAGRLHDDGLEVAVSVRRWVTAGEAAHIVATKP